MSKKRTKKSDLNTSQSNTLLNYFQSPKQKPKFEQAAIQQSRSQNDDLDDDDIIPSSLSRKRVRVIVDSDSDSENCEVLANNSPKTPKGKKPKIETPSTSKGLTDTPKSKRGKNKPPEEDNSSKTLDSFSFSKPEKGNDCESYLTSQKVENKIKIVQPQLSERWTHEKLDFLKPENIRDSNKNRPDHPDYDPKTLYIPQDYLNELTPAMRQWWLLKSQHMDCVMFFKVGKFYELYHMDAVVGVNNLGFSYMKGEFAHSGFPEIAYGRMAASLIEQGFKVIRIEQTETPEMMNERVKGLKKPTKYDKVVKREICQVTTKGTCVYGAQMTEAKNPLSIYLVAVAEKKNEELCSRYGVCFIDTSIGDFYLTDFVDDKYRSKLLLLLSQNNPGLILTETGGVTPATNEIFKNKFGNVRRENLKSNSQFPSADQTIERLQSERYFVDSKNDFYWPKNLKKIVEDQKNEYELALRALGACVWHLKDSKLDMQILSMGKFDIYQPLQERTENLKHMILDSVTIENLKLLGGAGTLQKVLDRCSTAFGKRLLQLWICKPLCNVDEIVTRQEAVTELVNDKELIKNASAILKKLPDLERQIAKIHSFGNKYCARDHPDARAILYEANTYSKRKITDLLLTLRALERAQEIPNVFRNCNSTLIRKITQHPPEGNFTDLSASLNFFKDAFDHEEAEKEGRILPQRGTEEDYDNAESAIAKINEELQEYLEEQREYFGCNVQYFGSDKKRYQLDIPEKKCHKVTDEYTLEGTKKGKVPSKRYHTPTTKALLAKMMKAEAESARIVKDLNRRIFEKFSSRYDEWNNVVMCLSVLDVLCSLADYAMTFSQDICCPKILPFSNNPIIKIENGRHACIQNIDSFIPNDTELGTEENPRILILTGPNMGGKSTLMRQVALINVMAQIGSYVPASSCELSLTDRIFTRLGARDDIVKGESTFLLEVSEAASILRHATKQSLVLLDELGRGTSTHDGNAISTAYLQKLLEINCRVIDSTHYHSMVEHFEGKNDIQLGHMECFVQNEGDVAKETVVFLYKLAKGACPKSYGFNVAKLAGLPMDIVHRAHELARQMEKITINRKLYVKLSQIKNASNVRALLVG